LSSHPSAARKNVSRPLDLPGWPGACSGLPLDEFPLFGIQTDRSGDAHQVALRQPFSPKDCRGTGR
jgi:hypothetical protein